MGLGLALAGVWAQEGADTPPVSHGRKFGAAEGFTSKNLGLRAACLA